MTYHHLKAFTLLETMVALSIVAIIAAFGINFLSTVIKDGSKATVTSEIKQNGNYALEVMSYYIRNASSIESCTSDTLTLKNGTDTIVLTKKDQTNSPDLNARIASNSTILTNADKDAGVNVTTLTFSCDLTKTPPLVSITMQLKQSFWVTRPESSATVDFQTDVALRNY